MVDHFYPRTEDEDQQEQNDISRAEDRAGAGRSGRPDSGRGGVGIDIDAAEQGMVDAGHETINDHQSEFRLLYGADIRTDDHSW